jgi:predicted DNA-binding transcriptional regulator AlpA
MKEPIPRLVFPRLPDRQQFLRAMLRVNGHLVWVITGSADLAPVPTLLDLVRDPTRIETLPRPVAIALYRDVVVVEALLRAHLLALSAAPVEPAPLPSEDRLLNIDEAAARLRVTPNWLYRHRHTLPFTRKLGRRSLRFSEQGLQKYLAVKRP